MQICDPHRSNTALPIFELIPSLGDVRIYFKTNLVKISSVVRPLLACHRRTDQQTDMAIPSGLTRTKKMKGNK